MAWANGPVRVTIVAAYIAMVDLTREAVRFVQERHWDYSFEVYCASADAIQGETLDYMVLALPPSTREWSEWLCDPSRLLTIMSRYHWQLVLTHVFDDGIRVNGQRREDSQKDSIQVILDMQRRANSTWTWHSMLQMLNLGNEDGFWDCWMQVLPYSNIILI